MSAAVQPWGWPPYAFVLLFIFRYLRFVIHVAAYLLYRPAIIPDAGSASIHPSDVTVVIASVEPEGDDFQTTLCSIIAAGVAEVIVVTIGEKLENAKALVSRLSSRIRVLSSSRTNKRAQLCVGLHQVKTKITLLMDDHVWFDEPHRFLRALLAPFEDESVGGVAVGKRVQRMQGLPRFSISDILNFIACLYLDRHNFDLAATNAIDGGVFVISGRTAAYRSSIICTDEFMKSFLNEYWFFNVGPLHADDDNCITRWLVNHGWHIKFQHSKDALMHTSLGVGGLKKFNSQCLRWVRTTWRSNSTSLFKDRVVWCSQPWCVYAVYLSSFFNFALFTDVALIILGNSSFNEMGIGTLTANVVLVMWILGSKLVKLLPHLARNPADIMYFPVYVFFAYYHSFIKLWALFTVNSLTWGSRPGVVA